MGGKLTVLTQQGLVRMSREAMIDTEISRTLLDHGEPGEDPLYAVHVKVTVTEPDPDGRSL